MKNKTMLVLVFLFSTNAYADNSVSREQSAVLLEQCQALRGEKMLALREREIKKCLDEKLKDASYCRNVNEQLGQSYNSKGKHFSGLFWDDPLCTKALKADKYFKANPSKDVFTP